MLLYLLIAARKKQCPKKEVEREMGKPSLASEYHGKPGNNDLPITRRMGNSEPPR
jgi:hypothetical protein